MKSADGLHGEGRYCAPVARRTRSALRAMALAAALLLTVPSAALRAAAPDVAPKDVVATFPVDRAMSKGDKALTLTLKNLSIGLYSLHIYGSVDPKGRTALDRVWKPCPMEFEARDAKGQVIAIGRRLLKQSFTPRLMQAFDIHVNEPGDVTATFRIGDAAMETARIQKIVMIDQLAGLPDEAIKKEQALVKGPSAQLKQLTDARKKRDDAIWEALPPLNIHLQVHGPSPAFLNPPAAANLPTWESKAFVGLASHQRPGAAFAGLDMINTKTHEVLTNDQVIKGIPWSGPHADDGTGIYLTQKEFPELKNDIYYSPRANLLGERTYIFLGLLGTWDWRGASLPKQYLEKGDPNVGHDAAMALVRLAYDWPAVEMTFHELRLSTGSPDFEYNTDWSGARRNGKYFYAGWSSAMAVDLITSYDQVFPYIKNNQVFADAVHRFIPWVKTPDDVVRLLDRWLVFASVRDLNKGLTEGAPVADIAAQVLGPSQQTASLFDLTKQYAEIYPFKGNYADLYAVALSRSGCYYIGSLMYDYGDAADTILKAMTFADAHKKGIELKMDLSDVEKYRKVKKAGDFLIDMFVAGGFPFMVGDASGGPHTGLWAESRVKTVTEASRAAVELWKDPRHAWLLKNLDGVKDPEIAKLAEGVADPILHNPSRVVPDYGAILEFGVDETDTWKKTAATLRLGCGQGHAHSDYLDLNLFGLGLPLAVDLACRDEGSTFWSRPGAGWAFLHNHAIAHDSDNPKDAGAEKGEPWLTAFAPPLLRASYTNDKGDVRLDRDVLLMEIGGAAANGISAPSYYAFDLQRLKGGAFHTWCFHGCESQNLQLNVPMEAKDPKSVRWIDRTLEGTQKAGASAETLQATWTMTRSGKDYPHTFYGGGVIKTVACEPAVLGKLYDPLIPLLHVRATLLGHAGEQVLQANPYSQNYAYCFPFLWVQGPAQTTSVFPAVYEWYRGDKSAIAKAELLQKDPARTVVKVTTATGQEDTYTSTPDSFLAVSRDAKGLRWAKLSGSATLEQAELTLKPAVAGYSTSIADIDYHKRILTTKDPLPANPGVTAGNSGRRIYLNLKGTGTVLTFDDDLIVNDGPITDLQIVDANTITAKTTQTIFHEGDGNRKAAGFTVVTEDHSWQFRGGKVIRKPQGATLTRNVFTGPNGQGFARLKTYEIGIGDSVAIPANITLRRTDAGYEVQTNVPVSGSLAGRALALQPAEGWQPVKGN